MNVRYVMTLGNASFEAEENYDDQVPVYMIADEAYRLALMFAETQYIAKYGRPIDIHNFGEMLRDLNYTYYINGVKYDD